MATTTFIDGQTTIFASWLNDVNTAVYTGVFPNGNLSITNLTVSGTVTGAGFTSVVNGNLLSPGPIGSSTANTGAFTTLSASSLTLTTKLAVAQGGTGLSTLTANNVILGNGTSSPTFVAPGTLGNVLTSNGNTWTSASAFGASQTWQSPTRASGTQYTNSTNLPIQVAFYLQSSNTSTISAVVGGITLYSGTNPSSTYISFIVPIGGTYTITWNNASSQSWSELR